MNEMTISARELLFAGAQLGAKMFFGLPDPFYGMTQEEIRREIGQMQVSLERKGYAQLGFDDAFTLTPEAAALVEVCAKCQRYLLVQLTPPEAPAWQLLVYSSEAGLVEAEVQDENVTLRRIAQNAVAERILAQLPPASGSGEAAAAVVKQEALTQARALAVDEPEKALELLAGCGCPAEMAALLVQGFRREAGRYVFCRSDFQTRTLDEMILLQNGSGAVCLTLADVYENQWKAEYLPAGATEQPLRALCTVEGAAHELL